jgi:mono/diheme cytochrome c family protein
MKVFVAVWFASASVLAAALTVAQQGKARSGKYHDDGLVYAELAKAPQKARVKRNPLEKDPDAPAAGRNLFEQHCSECHGNLAEGGRKGPSLRAAQVQNADPGAIFWILTNGVVWRGMPVWSKLPEPQRWQLVSYIKSLGIAEQIPAAALSSRPESNSTTESPLRPR